MVDIVWEEGGGTVTLRRGGEKVLTVQSGSSCLGSCKRGDEVNKRPSKRETTRIGRNMKGEGTLEILKGVLGEFSDDKKRELDRLQEGKAGDDDQARNAVFRCAQGPREGGNLKNRKAPVGRVGGGKKGEVGPYGEGHLSGSAGEDTKPLIQPQQRQNENGGP